MRKPDAESFRQLTISVEKLPASLAQRAKLEAYAADRARLLLGCYRTGDAQDPETYVAAIAATLAHFPEEVITRVSHPVSGLPSKLKWLPTVKEVHDACELAYEPIKQQMAREQRIKEQFAARQEAEERAQRPTYDSLKAKYGDSWGIEQPNTFKKPAERAPTKEELAEHYSKYDLAFQPKPYPERGLSDDDSEEILHE